MPTSPTVSVRGQATITAEPELATLTISVDAQGSDHRSTLEVLSQRAQAVAALIARSADGIERSETSRLHVYAELDPKKTEKVRRYVGHTTTTLVVNDFNVLSDLITGVGDIDLASVAGPWWRLRENSPVYREARLAAAADAMVRARDYAAAFGAELTGLVEIADEGMSHSGGPEFAAQSAMNLSFRSRGGGDESASFDLQPARQQVVGQVEARFLLSQPDLSSVVPAEPPA